MPTQKNPNSNSHSSDLAGSLGMIWNPELSLPFVISLIPHPAKPVPRTPTGFGFIPPPMPRPGRWQREGFDGHPGPRDPHRVLRGRCAPGAPGFGGGGRQWLAGARVEFWGENRGWLLAGFQIHGQLFSLTRTPVVSGESRRAAFGGLRLPLIVMLREQQQRSHRKRVVSHIQARLLSVNMAMLGHR